MPPYSISQKIFLRIILIFTFADTFSTTLMPLKPFPLPSNGDPSFEAVEFSGNTDRDMYPYTTFINHLFVYPLTLSFDSQKLFSRARNLALVMEIRDSDEEDAKAIPVILLTCWSISSNTKDRNTFNHLFFISSRISVHLW